MLRLGLGAGIAISQLFAWECLFDSFTTNEILEIDRFVRRDMRCVRCHCHSLS